MEAQEMLEDAVIEELEKVEVIEAEKTEAVPMVVEPKTEITVPIENGVLMPRNLEELKVVAGGLVRSGFLPDRYQNAAQVIAAYQMASELGLKPFTALRQIAVINGTPSLFGDLPLALCFEKNVIKKIDEYLVDADYNRLRAEDKNLGVEAYCAVCVIERNGQEPKEYFFSMDDAKKAGLYPASNPKKPWNLYPRYMMKYRARSQALKDVCPDVLNGLAIAEYDFNMRPDKEGHVSEEQHELTAAQLLQKELNGNSN